MSATADTFAVSEDGFTFPVREVLTGRGFVTGKSGSGKSNTASVIAEELLERGFGLLIVDTDGEYVGLLERYEMLHVGGDERCDLPIDPNDGERIAELALGENLPVLLDLSSYADEDESRAVLRSVVEALFVAERDHRTPYLVVLEEAHEFVSEGGGSTELRSVLIRVAKRGRKRGLGICALSQRPAAVDKDYITQCNWLVWHRLTWENDTAVADRILGDDAGETVQSLADGEAVVLTDWDERRERVQFRRKRTVDVGATPDLDAVSRTSSTERGRIIDDLRDGEASETRAALRRPGSPPGDRSDAPVDDRASSDSRVGTARAGEESGETADGDSRDPVGEGSEASADGGAGDEVNGPPAESRRRSLSDAGPDEYDPVWEVGLLAVHLFTVLVDGHTRIVARIETALSSRATALYGGESSSEPPSHLRRIVRYVAVALVLATYALLVWGIVTLA